MKLKIIIILFSSFLLPAVISGLFFCIPAKAEQGSAANFKSGEFLVKFKNNPGIYKFKTSNDSDIAAIVEKYKNQSEVEYIEPNYVLKMSAFPNDPYYQNQWYLNKINAKGAWSKDLLVRETEKNNGKAIIAILDTGVDLDHPDLKNKIWTNTAEKAGNGRDDDQNGYIDDNNGWDFVNNDSNPNPDFSPGYIDDAVKHGTIVASIAAAQNHNNEGIDGVSWYSQLMPLRVLDSYGTGDVYSVIQAINYAVDNGADVINMSFVGTDFSQLFFNAIEHANENNVLVVAAAGNTDPKANGVDLDVTKSYPVCYDGASGQNLVIGVASVNESLVKSSFSNYGGCIDLVAPGEQFYAAQVYEPKVSGFDEYYNGYWSGTSLSAPLVSGTLATIKALRPELTNAQIKSFLLNNTQDIYAINSNYRNQLGSGLLDSEKALTAALSQHLVKKGGENNYIIAGLGYGSFPQIKILKTDGSEFKSFYAYSPHFSGAINVASGDINGDGEDEIITGAGFSGGPHVRIFNIEGQLINHFFAYSEKSRSGVYIATGDINGDGIDEIITGAGPAQAPEVKVFDYHGNLISQFLAYGENFTGGVKVATGDVDNDGLAEIITGAGQGGGPHVRVFDPDGKLISQFFAYNQNYRGGINIASADLNGDNQAEIIASMEDGSVPTVRIFAYRGKMIDSFFAYEPTSLSGIWVSAGDIDNDGIAEIVTGKGVGGDSEIKVFDMSGRAKFEFFGHNKNYNGGVRPAVIRR